MKAFVVENQTTALLVQKLIGEEWYGNWYGIPKGSAVADCYMFDAVVIACQMNLDDEKEREWWHNFLCTKVKGTIIGLPKDDHRWWTLEPKDKQSRILFPNRATPNESDPSLCVPDITFDAERPVLDIESS